MSRTTIRDLGDGLLLRRSTPEDGEALVSFHARVLSEDERERPYLAAWVRDLMERPHPTFDHGDFALVEDTATGEIVSSLCLISQTWSYDGIEFGVGRPELVATDPDYRRRGLIRAQMEVVHGWSADRGELVQGITGIPWYYRQFGYEMAMNLGGGRTCYEPNVPKLEDGEEEPYHLRPVTEADVPFISQVYARASERWPVASVRNEALWRYEVTGKQEKNINRRAFAIIEAPGGEPLGFISHFPHVWQGRMGIGVYELKPGVSWLAVTPSVVRYAWAFGEASAAEQLDGRMETLNFWLGAEHPAYKVTGNQLPRVIEPYAWYLRVPDLDGFLRHVTPALESRLADSLVAGHTGELKLNLYRRGLHLTIEEGRLVNVESWQPDRPNAGDAGFPDLTFLQLLFGYRSVEELDHTFADCWTGSVAARVLLEALFPTSPSDVLPVS